MLVSVQGVQKEIEQQLLSKQPVNVAAEQWVQRFKNVSSIRVFENGVIQVKGGKMGQIIILTPEVIDEKMIAWKCVGGPDKAMPLNCRGV